MPSLPYRYLASDQDSRLTHALQRIQAQYGETCRIKPKALRKFGRTNNADNGVETTIMQVDGVIRETYSTTNDIDRIVSEDASFTGDVYIEGHYLDGNNEMIFDTTTVTANGQTPVAITGDSGGVPFARCTRMEIADGTFESPATEATGAIYAYVSSEATVTTGTPSPAAKIKNEIPTGEATSQKCATSISKDDYFILTGAHVAIRKDVNQPDRADIELKWRRLGGVFRPIGLEITVNSEGDISADRVFREYGVIPPNSDIEMLVTASLDNTSIFGYFEGLFATPVGLPTLPPNSR